MTTLYLLFIAFLLISLFFGRQINGILTKSKSGGRGNPPGNGNPKPYGSYGHRHL
jgi:hypothetical protein